ncbi:hypothetical protein BDN72DRAFT_877295 [Pluteus cervinus]|uniref:Uncharacterized protein n=1 Tax=Pluteus cervinus TaxID=181527 RepID=A0ACD3AZP6_9AGAR|nr:hypothetical protein BDN72DRAFT_877295 [Pluteus cervinus]
MAGFGELHGFINRLMNSGRSDSQPRSGKGKRPTSSCRYAVAAYDHKQLKRAIIRVAIDCTLYSTEQTRFKQARMGLEAQQIDNSSSLFLSLPLDICDTILSSIPSIQDLVSLASTCRLWASLILPHHSEYRKLWVHDSHPELWEHLKQREELIKGIREVHLNEGSLFIDPWWCEILPRTLLPPPSQLSETQKDPLLEGDHGHAADGDHTVTDVPDTAVESTLDSAIDALSLSAAPTIIQSALSKFKSLETFTWIQPWTSERLTKKNEVSAIFDVLKESTTLRTLGVYSEVPLPNADQEALQELEDAEYPLWHISNLYGLDLTGHLWTRWGKGSHLTSLLLRSPNLKDLRLSFSAASPIFMGCHFAQLRVLHLDGIGYDTPQREESILEFIQSHPTIEDLRWYPFDHATRPPIGFLPNLKRIVSSHSFAMGILRDKSVDRNIESVSQISLWPNTLKDLENVNGNSMEELRIWRYEGMDSVEKLAKFFPNVKILEIPKFGLPTLHDESKDYTLDDYIFTCSLFPRLEHLIDSAMWTRIQFLRDETQRAQMVDKLARWCPNLKRITNYDSHSGNAIDFVIVRGGERATWRKGKNVAESRI